MDVPEIDVDELERRLEEGAVLIDVRELDEWVEVRVPGGCLIPLQNVPERLAEIPEEGTVYVIWSEPCSCRVPSRAGPRCRERVRWDHSLGGRRLSDRGG